MKKKKLFALLFISLGFIFFSCETIITFGPDIMPEHGLWKFEFDKEQFERERQLWNEQNIQDYSYRVQFDSFYEKDLPDEGFVTVFNDLRVTIIAANDPPYQREFLEKKEGEYKRQRHWNPREAFTINEFYACLESEIADIKRRAESGEFDGVTVDINYHPDYHFPVSWSFTIYDEVERLVEVTTTVTTGGWGKSTEEVTKKYLSVEIKESHIDTQGGIQLTEFQPAASAP